MTISSKKISTTFQQITARNIPTEISIGKDDDGNFKERHGFAAIKFFFSKKITVDSHLTFNFTLSDEDSNVKKYRYACISFLEDSATSNQQMKKNYCQNALRREKERKERIEFWIAINNNEIFEISNALFKLGTKLKIIDQQLKNNTNIFSFDKENCEIKRWEYAQVLEEIKEKEKELKKLRQEQKVLFGYIAKNASNIKSLQYRINKLESKIKEKHAEVKIAQKEKVIKDLEIKIKSCLQENKQLALMRKKIQLVKEIVKLKQENDQVVTKVYEEIVLQGSYLYFITTLVHSNQSLTEEVVYIENDEEGEPVVWTQIKKYQNVDDYQKDESIVTKISKDNTNNFFCVTIKNFLLNLELAKNKISKSEWIVFASVTILSIILLAVTPVIAPFILAIAWEKALVSVIGVSIGWFVNKGIGALVADKTKKVEALMKKKVFSLMRKVFTKRSIGKTKEELDIKNNINKLTENLKSEKLETRLSTQFSILKSLLNVRKDIKANELIEQKPVLKFENSKTSVVVNNNTFNATKINNFATNNLISNNKVRSYSF